MYQDLKQKLKQQRIHLASTRNLLNKQLKLKIEIIDFVKHSEEKLNQALKQENLPSDKINKLRDALAEDQCLHTECKTFIDELQTNITATEKGIEKSKLKLHHIIFPKKTCGFFNQKNNDQSQSSNHITHFKDNIFKGA